MQAQFPTTQHYRRYFAIVCRCMYVCMYIWGGSKTNKLKKKLSHFSEQCRTLITFKVLVQGCNGLDLSLYSLFKTVLALYKLVKLRT